MGYPLDKTPPHIKLRLWKNGNIYHVMQRDGEGWEPLFQSRIEQKAQDFLEEKIQEGLNHAAVSDLSRMAEDRLRDWSRDVKIAGGWVCKCGEIDRELLESHHKKPKHSHPELTYVLDNGECICLMCHAIEHKDNPIVQNMVLARLALILYKRLYPGKEL